MKKFSLWIIVSIFTFLIGLDAVLTLLYYNQKPIAEVEPVHLFDNSCLQSKNFPGLSQKITEIKKVKTGYFPKYTWAGYDSADNSANAWSSEYLKSFGEKSFLDISEEKTEVYRFLWLRSFHHPIFVRIEKRDNLIQLFSKELDGRANAYNPGKVLRKEHKILTEQQWCNFSSLLEKSEYWKMPADYTMGRDGANWILEGVKDGRYHVVNRWSPENDEYREACIYLLKLSGFDTARLKHELY